MSDTGSINNQVNSLFPLPFHTGAAGSTSSTEGVSSPTNVANLGIVPAGLVLNAQGQLVSGQNEPDSIPTLPNVQGGGSGSLAQVQSSVASWLQMKPGSLAHALTMLSDLASDNMMTMQKIRTEAATNEYMTQQQSANELVSQVEGERASAWTKFAGSLVAGLTSVGLGLVGGKMSASGTPKNIIRGSVLSAAGTSVGQIINSTTDLLDKTQGGGYQADQAKIAKAYLDMLVTIFKSQDEGFNSEVQNAQKALQNVWDLKRQVADQTSQTLINTNSNV